MSKAFQSSLATLIVVQWPRLQFAAVLRILFGLDQHGTCPLLFWNKKSVSQILLKKWEYIVIIVLKGYIQYIPVTKAIKMACNFNTHFITTSSQINTEQAYQYLLAFSALSSASLTNDSNSICFSVNGRSA